MRASKRIALAGVSSALSTLCVIASCYVPIVDMSFLVLASLALLLPISKNDLPGAALSYLSSSLLSFLITGNIFKVLPYIAFFGPHPIVIAFVQRFRLPWPLAYLVKLAFANLAIFIAWRFLGLTVDISGFHFPYYLLAFAGSLGFLAYDWLIVRLKNVFAYYVDRFTNGKRGGRK